MWEQDTLKCLITPHQGRYFWKCLAVVMSILQKLYLQRDCGPRINPHWRRDISGHLVLWDKSVLQQVHLEHSWLCMRPCWST